MAAEPQPPAAAPNGLPPLVPISAIPELTHGAISRSAAYRLAAVGALPGLTKLPGSRMWVRTAAFLDWLNGQERDGAQPAELPSRRAKESACP